VALALASAALLVSCGAMPDDRPRVSIEFGTYPELLGGSLVIIDEQPVGRLEATGKATRISFPVEIGEHEVSIRHATLRCQKRRVDCALKGQKVRLLADLQEHAMRDGHVETVIVLQ
jgi:hypothetical protein